MNDDLVAPTDPAANVTSMTEEVDVNRNFGFNVGHHGHCATWKPPLDLRK